MTREEILACWKGDADVDKDELVLFARRIQALEAAERRRDYLRIERENVALVAALEQEVLELKEKVK